MINSEVYNTEIYKTYDYEIFKFIKGTDRNVYLKKLNRLMSSMQNKYMKTVIIVNEKYEIIDGQYRYEACRRLKLPLYYIIIEGLGLKDYFEFQKPDDDIVEELRKKVNKRKTTLEFQDVYTKTFEQYEQLKILRNKLNISYEKLMNQNEIFSKLTDEEKSKHINDFKNKSFDEIIRNNTSH